MVPAVLLCQSLIQPFYLQFCVKVKIMTPTPRVECRDSGFWGLGMRVSMTVALRNNE